MKPTEYQIAIALELVDFGPCRTSERPQDWIALANPLCAECGDGENVNHAAGRILAAAYRDALTYIEALEDVCDSGQLERAQSSLANKQI